MDHAKRAEILVGTAGWTIPKVFAERFPLEGSHLERYAQVLNAVEINSSFYRVHKPQTYERWARATPENFRFAVKLQKKFTHESRLENHEGLHETIVGIQSLGEKLGALLVQLPPSLQFESEVAREFFAAVRESHAGTIAFEPRHPSWASEESIEVLEEFSVSKVKADPERVWIPAFKRACVTPTAYYRLHGSPEMYRSSYEKARLDRIVKSLNKDAAAGRETWCIFDNTTFGFGSDNACYVRTACRSGNSFINKID